MPKEKKRKAKAKPKHLSESGKRKVKQATATALNKADRSPSKLRTETAEQRSARRKRQYDRINKAWGPSSYN